MIIAECKDISFQIRPVAQDELDATLAVYRACEDFLALGPVAIASLDMVLKDLQISREGGGIYCGIYTPEGSMIGVIDYVPNRYRGDPHAAYLSLLMIASTYRNQGIGDAVVRAIEEQIGQDDDVTVIYSGVQFNNPRAIRFWQGHGYRLVSAPTLQPDGTTAMDLQKDLA